MALSPPSRILLGAAWAALSLTSAGALAFFLTTAGITSSFDTARNSQSYTVFSLGNSKATAAAGSPTTHDHSAFTNLAHSTGKYAFRVTENACASVGGGHCEIGIAAAGETDTSYLGNSTLSIGMGDTGQSFINALSVATGRPSFVPSNTIDVEVDLDGKTIAYSVNGGAFSSPTSLATMSDFRVVPSVNLYDPGDAFTYDGTVSFPGFPAWNSTPASTPPVGSQVLIGNFQSLNDTPNFCAVMGRCPDFTIDYSYLGPGATGSNPCQGIAGYPLIVDFPPLGPGVEFSDPAAAANGSYNSAYAQTITQLLPCASKIYAIRMASEWYLCTGGANYYNVYYNFSSNTCDGTTQIISPATFIAMMRNLSNTIRTTLSNAGYTIPLEWDSPKASNQTAYDIGTAYYDLGGIDYYFFPQWLGNDPTQALNNALSQGLQFSYDFSTAAGKPFIIPESCDAYNTNLDPNGVFWNTVGPWLNTHTVAYVYWDSESGAPGCSFSNSTPKTQGYAAQFGNGAVYGGTYWTHKALPSPNPFQ